MEIVKKYFENELFKASFILLVLINFSNLLNYLFHFIMGRMLGPSDYGTLAVLASIIYIISVPTSSIQTLVARRTTRLNVKKEYSKINGMFRFMLFEGFILALIIFTIFVAASYFIAPLLKIPFFLVILAGAYVFGAFLSPIGLGVLQGIKKFSVWGWNAILNSSLKIVFAILLVAFGFGVYGPILGFFFGVIISFVFIFPYIKEITSTKVIKEKVGIISFSSIPILAAVFIITLMYSLDIIFVKLFFSSEIAGKYAVVSMIGKMIFFATSSISNVMFPISSERFFEKNKEKISSVIKKSFLMILGLCTITVIAFLVFPELIIKILFGARYLETANILIFMGLAYSFISLTYTFILYKLSVDELRLRHLVLLLLFLAIQIALFIAFKENLVYFSMAFAASTFVTFIGSLMFIRKWKN